MTWELKYNYQTAFGRSAARFNEAGVSKVLYELFWRDVDSDRVHKLLLLAERN